MEWLQTLLDNSTTPALTAFLLGLLTAVSPCPLATNIAAIGFIGKDIENRRRIFRNGLLYTLGRVVAYTVLGIVLILVLREGSSLFGIQKFIGKYGELILGPALLRPVHAVRQQTQTTRFRLQRKRRKPGSQRRLGSPSARNAVRNGILSDKRRVLFRHADSDVGNSNRRLSVTRIVCHCHCPACSDRCLDIGI